MFAMQTTVHEEAPQLGAVKVSQLHGETETAKFDLTFEIEEAANTIQGKVSYNRDLYTAESIERLAAQFARVIAEMVRDSEQRVNRISLLSETERAQIVESWNETARDYERGVKLPELIEQQAALTPDAVAVVSAGEQMSYRELNERANQLAHYLIAAGVGPEVLVAVLMERSVELVVSLLAVLKAGGAYIPLDPVYPRARVAAM